jgi:hypothetical protein
MTKKDKLTKRQEAFVEAILVGKSQRVAYLEAGYKQGKNSTIDAAASRMYNDPKIAARLARLRQKVEIKQINMIAMSATEVAAGFREIYLRALANDEFNAATNALDKLAKQLGYYAPEKHEHTGKDGGAIKTKELSDNELNARIAELATKISAGGAALFTRGAAHTTGTEEPTIIRTTH